MNSRGFHSDEGIMKSHPSASREAAHLNGGSLKIHQNLLVGFLKRKEMDFFLSQPDSSSKNSLKDSFAMEEAK